MQFWSPATPLHGVWGVPGAAALKNLPANAGPAEYVGLTLGQKDPLEEEMATPSNILAWKIICTEEPGRLQSTVSQRIGTQD